MAYDDLLVCFTSYPEPTPPGVIGETTRLAASFGVSVCAVAGHVAIPLKSNPVAEMLLHLSEIAEVEEAKSLQNAQSVLRTFQEAASGLAVSATTTILRADLHAMIDRLTQAARTRSLTILPIEAFATAAGGLAEALIFNSGRPVVIFAPGERLAVKQGLEHIVIAWDGGRAAARAVGDAMPLLRRAKRVSILSVTGEKPSVTAGTSTDLVRHLAACGVVATADEIRLSGSDVGRAINDHAVSIGADLLVMGAFGHSRIREFVLGGATQSLLTEPKLPVFMSH